MTAIVPRLHRFLKCRSGATGGEYAICIALLVVVAVAALSALGGVAGGVQDVSDAISQQHLGAPLDASLSLTAQSK